MDKLEFDDLDLRIMRELEADGRRSNVEIAKAVKASEGTVRRRIANLLDSGIGKVVLTFNPLKLGLNVEVFLNLRVELGRLEDVAVQLVSYEEINYVGLTSGDFDIVIHCVFHDNDEVYRFITDKIASIDGVLESRTAFVLKAAKRSRRWTPVQQIHAPATT